jgi:ribosomal protein S18 acetylase RimI-like enzyme
MAGPGGVRAVSVGYRMATPEDSERVAALFRRCFCDTFGHLYDPRDLAVFLSDHSAAHWRGQLSDEESAIRLVEDGDQLAGFANFGSLKLPVELPGNALELRQLYVLKPWHGSGVARDLMNWLLVEARQRGADNLYLSVYTENHRARRFYANYGFEEVGPYAFMVGNQADEDIIMRLAL